MSYLKKHNIPYEQIENGALMLLLLRECKTWNDLCGRYEFANPEGLADNTTTMTIRDKLFSMRDLGLVSFEDEETTGGKRPVGEIKDTGLWSKIRVAFGGMSLTDAALLSRHASGIAISPVFDRPRKLEEPIDVFVLMPFSAEMERVYTHHIKMLGDELGITIQRADDIFTPKPFMEKVWDGIYAARLVVADCTQRNANVFYEIGIAHTLGKQVILITRSDEDIPSDIKHYNYIRYQYDPEGVEQLMEKLRNFIRSQLNELA